MGCADNLGSVLCISEVASTAVEATMVGLPAASLGTFLLSASASFTCHVVDESVAILKP